MHLIQEAECSIKITRSSHGVNFWVRCASGNFYQMLWHFVCEVSDCEYLDSPEQTHFWINPMKVHFQTHSVVSGASSKEELDMDITQENINHCILGGSPGPDL